MLDQCTWKLPDGKPCGQSTRRGEALLCEPLVKRDDLCDLHRFALRREWEERAQVALQRIEKAVDWYKYGRITWSNLLAAIGENLDWAKAVEKTETPLAALTSVKAEVVTNV